MKEFWNNRYSNSEYAYGIEPNEFFASELKKISPGRILLYGEGEGRNAVFASKLGWKVDAVDFSESGKNKALSLASKFGLEFNYTIDNLTSYQPEKEAYDSAAIIFVHFEEEDRQIVHSKIFEALKPGGKLIMEVFEKGQINLKSGGPKTDDMLYTLEDIYTDFNELEIDHFSKQTVYLNEGPYHRGEALVIRLVGTKTK